MPDNLPLAAPGLVTPGLVTPGLVTTARPARQHAWEGGLARWDAYDGLILAATLVILVATRPPYEAVAAAALLAMAPWYALVGRPLIQADDARPWRAVVYLSGLLALLLVAELAGGTMTFILLALCPQCFMMAPFRTAAVAATLLNFAPLPAAFVLGLSSAQLAITAAIALVGAVFSLAFGHWIIKIISQSEERADLIEALEATQAALGVAHRQAGVAAERQRISAEIHDTIAQGFASIVMLLQAAEASLGTDQEAAARQLRLATETARENLAEARALVAGLTPTQLAGGTLDDALRRVTAQARSQGGIAADLEVTGAVRPLATSAEVMLLRVCQEALSNVRKHAGASRATILLAYGEAEVRLVISDDGAGFDPGAACAGYGLRGMRTRAAEAGGSFGVRSAPREGTAVSVTVPA
jgi:signal transduction histidine kinase